jgi:hypothetical protein
MKHEKYLLGLFLLILSALAIQCKKKGTNSNVQSLESLSPTQDFAPKAQAIEGCLEK